MSASWNLYSFDQGKLDLLFGSAPEAVADALAEILIDEGEFDFDDPEVAETVARRVTSEGLFEAADEDEQDVLNCLRFALFVGAGPVAEFLGAAPESPNGIHVNVTGELLKRADGLDLPLLALFGTGRRLEKSPCEFCEYIVFSPEEIRDLLAEVKQVIALEREWSHPDFLPEVEKEVLTPLANIAEAGRGAAALYP